MIKYVDTLVGFSEVPDEITLCINISNCPNKCRACHSPWLRQDIGTPLTSSELKFLIESNKGITCVSFMGGDAFTNEVNTLAKYVKSVYPHLKTCWYSGKNNGNFTKLGIELCNFDFIKIGSFIKKRGPLNDPNTNQHMFEIKYVGDKLAVREITHKFWKNGDKS